MATSVTLVSLSQMVDVALNCHEGLINFQALHTLLNVMIQQLSLHNVAVEFRGADSDRIVGLISTHKSQTSLYPEYTIVGEKGRRTKKKKPKTLKDVLAQQKKDGEDNPSVQSPEGSTIEVKTSDIETVVVVESGSSLPVHSVALSKTTFQDLLSEIEHMKNQIRELTALPTNESLIDAVKTHSGPVLDMLNIINLTKRVDAAELALAKMGSLLEEILRNTPGDWEGKVEELKNAVDATDSVNKKSSQSSLELRVQKLEKLVKEIKKGGRKASNQKEGETDSVQTAETGDVDYDDDDKGEQHEKGRDKSDAKSEADGMKMFTPQRPFISIIQNVNMSEMSGPEAQKLTQEEFKNLNDWINESIEEFDREKIFGPSSGGDVNVQIIDGKFQECAKQIHEMNEFYNTQIGTINERFNTVQEDIRDVIKKLQVISPGGDSTGVSAESTLNLASKLELLEKEMLSLIEQADKVEEEKKENDLRTQGILEQIDVLKIVKANREDLEDALGDKADSCAINRKVSHDQFEATCDNLTHGIEEALDKLEHQEELWRQAFETIQQEMGHKLDKLEVDPLKEFVNNKLKALQDKFKALTALKRDQQAAATKTKLLKNVNCISCDKDVVMQAEMDPSSRPKPYALPPGRNMAPYLAYELDQLRKQQKCAPGKNLNFVENARKFTRGQRDKDHICNRYCGGSHTVTTPQQRVTRIGHFLDQWGPEISPLHEEYVKGSDKQMYKARDGNLYKSGRKDRPSTGLNKLQMGAITPQLDSQFIDREARDKIAKDEEQRNMVNATSLNKNYNIGSGDNKAIGSGNNKAQGDNASKESASIVSKKSETKSSRSNLEITTESKVSSAQTEKKDSHTSAESKQ